MYRFKVCGQNDTLGNVVQYIGIILSMKNHWLISVDIRNHPLEEYITFTFALNPSNKTFGKSEEVN